MNSTPHDGRAQIWHQQEQRLSTFCGCLYYRMDAVACVSCGRLRHQLLKLVIKFHSPEIRPWGSFEGVSSPPPTIAVLRACVCVCVWFNILQSSTGRQHRSLDSCEKLHNAVYLLPVFSQRFSSGARPVILRSSDPRS